MCRVTDLGLPRESGRSDLDVVTRMWNGGWVPLGVGKWWRNVYLGDDVWCKFGLTHLKQKYDRIQLYTTIESLVLEFEDFLISSFTIYIYCEIDPV